MQRYIDHTLLKADAKTVDVEKLCAEAIQHDFFSVCVNSSYASLCKSILCNSHVKVCCVVGFPLGAMSTAAKAFETKQAVLDGADEIDMVIHVGALKEGRSDYVQQDIAAVVQAASGRTVKVIIETSLLSDDEKKVACQLALKAKAHFVKTSTGFGGGGANVHDIQLMKSEVNNLLGVKASGGIKDLVTAKALIEAGATRLGTSSGIALVSGATVTAGVY